MASCDVDSSHYIGSTVRNGKTYQDSFLFPNLEMVLHNEAGRQVPYQAEQEHIDF